MILFVTFLFFIIGIASANYSCFYLILTLPLIFISYKKSKDRKVFYLLLVTAFAFLFTYFYPKGNNVKEITGIIIRSKENYFLLLTIHGRYYISCKNNPYNLFAILKITGKREDLSFYHYESCFDFKDYLKSKAVFYSYSGEITELVKSYFSLDKIQSYILSYANDNCKSIVSSFLFSNSLYANETEGFQNLGIINYLTISGFHISYLLQLIKKLLPKVKEKYLNIIDIVFILICLIFSSFSLSIIRILLFKIITILNKKFNFNLKQIEKVSLIGLIFLLINPYNLLSPSFYYSFPLLFYFSFFKDNKQKTLKNYITLQAFYLPYNLLQNNYFSLLSYPLQLVFIPLSHILFVSSFLLFLLPQFAYILNYICNLIFIIVDRTDSINIYFNSGSASLFFAIAYYFLLVIYKALKQYNYKNQKQIILGILILSTSLNFTPDLLNHNEIVFIDVDQGDSTLLRYKTYNILIDTGGKKSVDLAKEALIPYFKKRKIRNLDAVLITHSDYDHQGALNSLVSNFTVKKVFYRSDFILSNNYSIQFDDLTIKNLNIYKTDNEDENYNSCVFYTEIKKKKILVMGDAPKEIEVKILQDNPQLDCDYIKLGHHGSNTSSDYTFLKQVTPELAIISCGENNYYGHPHQETLQTLNSLNINYKRTDKDKTIEIKL